MKEYSKIFDELNKENISWCLIKDINLITKGKYDKEIDLITYKKNRNKIRNLAKKNGWNESSLNKYNTHVILWKFKNNKPYRIDFHMGISLATAVPWFSAKELLKNKIKIKNVWCLSKEEGTRVLGTKVI